MEDLTFAPWIEPYAMRYRAVRHEAVRLARMLGDDDLGCPTGDTGWTVRDELVHIANDGEFIAVLDTILRRQVPDISAFADIDGRNARHLAASRDWPMRDVASTLAANGDALQQLLARITPEDESFAPEGVPYTLKAIFDGNSTHDAYHVDQIHRALRARSTEVA